MNYTVEELRSIFQNKFDMQTWYDMLRNMFHATAMRTTPELFPSASDKEEGYFIGKIDNSEGYSIGLFYFRIHQDSISHKRVGLRQLVKTYINPNTGLYDAALVVFEGDNDWRLSFISDIKGEETSPKRYTFVFGDKDNFYNTPVGRFNNLQHEDVNYETLCKAFSVEALTKQFYNELFDWYQWAVAPESQITFPNNVSTPTDDKEDIDIKIIRLITRIMFVWFIKQKELVPDKIFNVEYLKTILKDFDENSESEGNYYNAILQNLFFATLNRAIEDENGKRRFAHNVKKDVKTLYRYAELFQISEDEVVNLFSSVPFLNGGLFECLDKVKTLDGVEKAYYYDGFSRNNTKFANGRYSQRAVIPNRFFFDKEKGLFSILNRYNFTIEENTPNEQQVALDPELLGKVFENLLGAYNPETRETARNQSGSFYTPREIVEYMTDASLKAYLGNSPIVESLLCDDFAKDDSHEMEYKEIADKLRNIKILDPACGSGAFPMGLLNRIVDILQKIESGKSLYEQKLYVIEHCIYGSDIQSIASQISKLRFFISLICDCEKDETKENFGIPTLPNLETKFVAANSLLSKKKRNQQLNLFEDPRIQEKKNELAKVRHLHFSAKTANQKRELRLKDEQLRKELSELLSNSLYAPEDAIQLAMWNPYDQNAVASFFDPEWMFGVKDFDIVIGNPPYIQLQNNGGELAQLYQSCEFQTFARTGDIYCLFYERGWQLLKPGGHLCYITSNKWMRAGYGEKTREFFATKTNPQLLIDFAGTKVFESATVDVNILLFENSKNNHDTWCAVVNKQNSNGISNLSDFVQTHGSPCDFTSGESWVILSPIEQSIKQKIEAVGTPLKDWDIQINYGIKTGCNEAFIVDEAKRTEILNNCTSEEERKKTAELIRPILRGRDIKRYGYEWAGLYLIATFPSRHYDIDDYPAVKGYLLSFAEDKLLECGYNWVVDNYLSDFCFQKLSQTGQFVEINGQRIRLGNTDEKARKRTSNKWFETQDSISYWEDFDKPKIMYAEIVNSPRFYLDRNGEFLPEATTFILTGYNLDVLIQFFNSRIVANIFKLFYAGGGLGEHGYRYKKQFFEKLPIPLIEIDVILKDEDISALYGLNKDEYSYLISI